MCALFGWLDCGKVLPIRLLKKLTQALANAAEERGTDELEYFKSIGVRIKILDIPTTLTDFPSEQMWVMDMINAILIEVLGSIAENERNKIRSRQREGIEAAKKKNIPLGRPALVKPDNFDMISAKVKAKEMTVAQAIKILNISRSSYYRLQRKTV